MLRATVAGDTKTMEEILRFAHDTESPILTYNSEVELSAVVNLCYLSARISIGWNGKKKQEIWAPKKR